MAKSGETIAATFLFTDLVGSTELASGLSTGKAEELRQTHFGLLRGAIEASGGREVKNLGDGLMVVFLSPSRALACAVRMQQAIERHNRRSTLQLGIRIGLSIGEAIEEDADFFGDPVIEAARLCARARGGQILATSLVQMTLGRRATQAMVPVGDLELKGLPEPVPAVEVVWEPNSEEAPDRVPLPGRLAAPASGGLFGFSGRTAESERLVQAQKASEAGLQVVLVAGEPGVGKTALAVQAARAAHAIGVSVLLGVCNEEIGTPYQPWVSAVSHFVRHCPSEVRNGLSAVQAGALRRFLPADVHLFPEGETVASDPDTEQYLLMDAVTHLFELASQNGAVLLLIDDLHWADAASLAMFRHIIGASTAGLHLMIVATYRDSELSPTHPLTRFLADLHREPCVSRLALIGLDDTEVIELIEGAAGYGLDEEGIDLAHALRRETGGNPFFVGEMLRHLGESGAFVMDQVGRFSLAGDVTDLALPPSVRDVVTRRVARLGDEALRVLSLAAVVGQEFSLDVLDAVTETGVEQLLDLLEAATTAAIVIEVPDLPGRYRFLHALIQHTLYHELSAARRQRHHLQVAEALEQSEPAPGDESKHIAELARHWLAATTPAKMAKAIDYCRRAGDAAENALAVVDAAGWYGKALELAERDPTVDRELRCRLLIALGSAQMVTNADPGRTTMREAGTLAEDIGDPDLLVTWATTRLSGWRTSEAADPQALRLTRKALELVGEESATLKARLLGVLTEETDPWEWRERRDLARAARAAAEVAGDDATTLDVFLATDFVISADQAAERSRIAARAVEIAERGTNPISLGAALINYADSLLTLGDIAQARGVISRNQAMAAEYALPPLRHGAEMQGAVLSMVSGDLAALEHHADNMLRLSEEVPQSLATYGGSLFELRWAQGRLSEFAALFSDAVSEMRSYAGFRPAMVVAYLEADDFDRARTLFADDASNGFEAFPRDTIWLACMSLYAEAAIRLADIGAAEALYGLLSPYDALHCAGGPIYYGSVDRSIGGLAAFLGRPEEAEHRLHHALEVHRAVGAQYWTARTGLDLAEHLLNGEGSGRGEEGALLLDECDRLSTTGGYGGVSRRAALLRRRLA